MNSARCSKLLYVVACAMLYSMSSQAKVFVNSMCYMNANAPNQIVQGDSKVNDMFPLASTSKVMTSLWSVSKLKAAYRFKTNIYITKASSDSYDVHIEGGRDPIFGRNSSYYLISELNRLGVKKIESLTFDENFLIAWRVEEEVVAEAVTPLYKTVEAQAEAVRSSLEHDLLSKMDVQAYNQFRAQAAKAGVVMTANPTISARRVEFVAKKDFTPAVDTQLYTQRSAPLANILKKMNTQSNNYIADNLFWNLGGAPAFETFIKAKMNVSESEVEFFNGSGNNEARGGNQAIYNEADCQSMARAVYFLQKELESQGLRLEDVMAVASEDRESTVAGYGGAMTDSTVAKTGTVNKAKTLVGRVSTKKGVYYFAILMHTDADSNRSDSGVANQKIKTLVNGFIRSQGGPEKIDYTQIPTMPIDKGSRLTEQALTGIVKLN